MSNKLVNNIKYWLQVFILPIHYLSYLMPRSKKIWVFGSTFGRRFADNPKYFYLYINQFRKDNIRAIWITKEKNILRLLKEKGYEVYLNTSLKGIWFSLRAKVYLYDNYSKDISFILSGGAKKINMWHGIPLKKINMDNKFDIVRNPRSRLEYIRWCLRRMSDEKPWHYVLAASEYLRPIFSSAFATKLVLTSGYPRNDSFKWDIAEELLTEHEKEILEKIKKFSIKRKIILYMPTFRESEIKYFDVVDMHKFDLFLSGKNILFCIKLHPKSKVRREFNKYVSENILVIDADIDPYILLKYSNVLITDYSSIYFDFLLLNKPIIFFNYDMQEYLKFSREMYFLYEEVTPGIKVQTIDGLMNYLHLLLDENVDDYVEKRLSVKKLFLGEEQESYSEILYYELCNILKK